MYTALFVQRQLWNKIQCEIPCASGFKGDFSRCFCFSCKKCKPAFAFCQEFTPSPFLTSKPKALTKMLLSQNDKLKVLYTSYVWEGLEKREKNIHDH